MSRDETPAHQQGTLPIVPDAIAIAPKRTKKYPKKEKGYLGERIGRHDLRLNKVLVQKLVDAVYAGNTLKNAARLCGMSDSTIFKWLADTDRTKKYKVEFIQRMREAEAKAIHRNVMVIQQHAKKDWRASAWYLERRNQAEWLPVQRVEQSGPNNGPIEMSIAEKPSVSKADVKAILDAIKDAKAEHAE
jgi:hypothetical protein